MSKSKASQAMSETRGRDGLENSLSLEERVTLRNFVVFRGLCDRETFSDVGFDAREEVICSVIRAIDSYGECPLCGSRRLYFLEQECGGPNSADFYKAITRVTCLSCHPLGWFTGVTLTGVRGISGSHYPRGHEQDEQNS